jgi:hypothetical protein
MKVEYHFVLRLLSMALVGGNALWLPLEVAPFTGRLLSQEADCAAVVNDQLVVTRLFPARSFIPFVKVAV